MTRLKLKDILKPGAVLEVKKIDWDSPEVKSILKEHKRAIKESKRIKVWRYDGWWRKIQ